MVFENFVIGCGWGLVKKRVSDRKKEGGLRWRMVRWLLGKNILNWLKSKMNYIWFEMYLIIIIRFRKNWISGKIIVNKRREKFIIILKWV